MKPTHRSAVSFLRRPLAAAILAISASLAFAATPGAPITEADVIAAQQAWGNALVQISTEYDNDGIEKARATAQAVIDAAYGYAQGPVLFKPTLASAPQTFRTTAEGALAYFVGHDDMFPNDSGFALKGWRSFEVANAAIYIDADANTAMSMGNVSVTDKDGKVTTVDKTWGYSRDDAGALRIVLHHSSLPYQQ